VKIAIIGAGAVGLLTAKVLEDKGHDVTLIVRSPKEGPVLFQTTAGEVQLVAFKLTTDWELIAQMNLVIVATKTYHLNGILSQLMAVTCPILFLQNGLIKDQVEQTLDCSRVLYGSVDHGALLEGDMLMHRGEGTIRFGGNEKFRHSLNELAPALIWEDKIEDILFRKAILNTLINPLTALVDVPNGELWSNQDLQRAVISHYDELHMAFPEVEQHVTLDEVFELIKRTRLNSSSMRKDVLQGSQTEASAILLPLIERAEKANRYLPITSYLFQLIQSKRSENHTERP